MDSRELNGPHGIRRFVTVPNLLSLSRLFLLPLILLMLVREQGRIAIALMVVSWITDGLDGYFARRLNQVSNMGRVLDHLVDKIWIGAVLVMLVSTSDLPVHIAASVILRDLLILAGSLVIMKSRGAFVSSDVLGKITGFAFAVLIAFYTLRLDFSMPFKGYVDNTVTVLIIVSFLNYVAVFLRRMWRIRLPSERSRNNPRS